MKTYPCQVEITKRGAQRLQMKMRHVELNLKEATIIYGLQPHSARSPELALKLENYAPTCSTPSTEENIRASFALSMHSSVHFAEMTGELALLHCM